jgi:putative sporulation protein YyaC
MDRAWFRKHHAWEYWKLMKYRFQVPGTEEGLPVNPDRAINALHDLRVSVHDTDAKQRLTSFLGRLLREIDPEQSRPLVLIAIGSDRLTGDSLGPLVGSRAQELAPGLPIYGTLEEPVHAINLADTIKKINRKYRDPLVVAVDACLGQARNVGTVSIGRGALCPGTGVHKDLPPVGEVAISGVVNVGGFLEFLVLQNTRLCLVMQIADCIARALAPVCTIWTEQCAAAAAYDDLGAAPEGERPLEAAGISS